MDELISRQAAIDALADTECYEWEEEPGKFFEWDDIEKMLRGLPPVQPNLQPTCNKLATDCISRQAVLDWLNDEWDGMVLSVFDGIRNLPSAQPEIIRCKDCKYAPKCYGDVLMRSKGGGYIYCPVKYCSEAKRRTDG